MLLIYSLWLLIRVFFWTGDHSTTGSSCLSVNFFNAYDIKHLLTKEISRIFLQFLLYPHLSFFQFIQYYYRFFNFSVQFYMVIGNPQIIQEVLLDMPLKKYWISTDWAIAFFVAISTTAKTSLWRMPSQSVSHDLFSPGWILCNFQPARHCILQGFEKHIFPVKSVIDIYGSFAPSPYS